MSGCMSVSVSENNKNNMDMHMNCPQEDARSLGE